MRLVSNGRKLSGRRSPQRPASVTRSATTGSSAPEWTRTEVLEFRGSTIGPWRRYIVGQAVPDTADAATNVRHSLTCQIGTVRYPRIVAKDEECAKHLKKRTLTNLYNERPTWLDLAHQKLDAAVFAAYGWDAAMPDDDLLAALLALNLESATEQNP